MRQTDCPYTKAIQWYLGWSYEDVTFCLSRLKKLNPTFSQQDLGNSLLELHRHSERIEVEMASVTAVVLANRIESVV